MSRNRSRRGEIVASFRSSFSSVFVLWSLVTPCLAGDFLAQGAKVSFDEKNFVVFEDDGARLSKKVAAYHQYHAVNRAIDCTNDHSERTQSDLSPGPAAISDGP